MTIETDMRPESALEILAAKPAMEKKPVRPSIAPFYLTAKEYLALRGEADAPYMVLNYDVTSKRRGMFLPITYKAELILGTDYVVLNRETSTQKTSIKIYDFKLNRLLTITPQTELDGAKTGKMQFDNVSLYAHVYRNITAVRQITQNGQKRNIVLGKDEKGNEETLEAFWIESAMSWAATRTKLSLGIEAKRASLDIVRNDETIFSARFSPKPFKNRQFKNSFLAFVHQEWPLHPRVLQALYEFEAPAEHIEILSYGPKALQGEVQTWVLTARETRKGPFPLPLDALGVTQRKPSVPLAFIINEAAHGRALGGPADPAQIAEDFYTQREAGNPLSAWLLAQQYIAYTGQCAQQSVEDMSSQIACADVEDLERAEMKEGVEDTASILSHYIKATRKAKYAQSRIEAVKAFAPYLEAPKTPAIIIRTAAMARAKIKPEAAKKAGLSELRAEDLLKLALTKDPYDPHTYEGLAQVYAANGATERSWDIYDALRASLSAVRMKKLRIDSVEEKLRVTAPGYFLEP